MPPQSPTYSEFFRSSGVAHIMVAEDGFANVVRKALDAAGLPTPADLSDLLDDAREFLGRATRELNWAKDGVKKRDIARRLEAFSACLDVVSDVFASTGRLRTAQDVGLLTLVSTAAATADETPGQAIARYAALRISVDAVRKDVAKASVFLGTLSADGQPRLHGYDHVVTLALQIAERVGIALTTGGDRGDDQHATPFTLLVQGLDSFLPKKLQAKTLAACARRVERSAPWSEKKDRPRDNT